MNKKKQTLIILGIIFISFNLRAPITAVGSLVKMISNDYNLNSTMAGFITTLPLIAFAVISPFVARVSKKLGSGKTMLVGLVFIIIGEIVRSYTNVIGLYIGTTLIGIGIAIGNVLIPSIIKLNFKHRVGAVTSIYTSSMCIFAALGAGISMPLATGLNLGWQISLAFWLILALITTLIWLPQLKPVVEPAKEKPVNANVHKVKVIERPIWKSKTAWWVTLFMGIQSLIFYSLVAWLPTMITAKGLTSGFASNMALTFQLMAIPATLLIPILCDKFRHQKFIALIVTSIYFIGMSMLALGNNYFIVTVAIVLMSLAMGGSISLSIAFISLRTHNAHRASELSGMSQSVGYLLAAVGPTLMGKLVDLTGSWNIPFILFLVCIALLAYCGLFAGRDKVTSITM